MHNVYDHPSWLERFVGEHPPQIEAMRRDMRQGRLEVKTRNVDDIERLLMSRRYRTARLGVKALGYVDGRVPHVWPRVRPLAGRLLRGMQGIAAFTGRD